MEGSQTPWPAPPQTSPTAQPPSPFDRVRARVVAVMMLATGVAVQVLRPVLFRRAPDDWWDLASSLAFAAAVGALLLAYVRVKGVDVSRLVGRVPRDWRAWALAAVAAPLLVFSIGTAALQFSLLATLAPGLAARMHDTPGVLGSATGTGAVLLQALAGVLAGVMEELLFRGVLLGRWERRWGAKRAVIASSLAFAVLHLDLVGAFVFAVVMCCLYLRTRSLLVPILAHAGTNAAIALSDLGGRPGVAGPPAADLAPDWGAAAIVLAVAMPFVAWFLYVTWPRGEWRLPYYDRRFDGT